MGEHLSASDEPGIIREPGVVGGREEFIANADLHVPVQSAFDSAHGLIGKGHIGVAGPVVASFQVKRGGNATGAASDIRCESISERRLENQICQQGNLIEKGAISNGRNGLRGRIVQLVYQEASLKFSG